MRDIPGLYYTINYIDYYYIIHPSTASGSLSSETHSAKGIIDRIVINFTQLFSISLGVKVWQREAK